jgi:hypothetical protein
MPDRSTQRPAAVRPPLRGWRVDCCCVDDEARLLFLYSPDATAELDRFELALRGPFWLRLDDGGEFFLDPTGPPQALGPLLALYDTTVDEASVAGDGSLTLSFTGGAVLHVEPDLLLEAWQLCGPRRQQTICLPAGDGFVSFGGDRRAAVG